MPTGQWRLVFSLLEKPCRRDNCSKLELRAIEVNRPYLKEMNRLEEILRAKREEIETLRPQRAALDGDARARKDFRGFQSALQPADQKLSVIAEIKKASPSAGLIAHSFNPVGIAE